MSHPRAVAWATTSAGGPARPESASRRNSARYLLSTAETACSLVMARAATVAARSSRWTSSAVRTRSSTKTARRPWLVWPAAMRHHGAAGVGCIPGPYADGLAFGDEPTGPVEAVEGKGCLEVLLRPRLGQHASVTAGDHRRAAEELRQAPAQVLQATTGEHDVDEDVVGLLDAFEDPGLLVEHGVEHLGEDPLGTDRGRGDQERHPLVLRRLTPAAHLVGVRADDDEGRRAIAVQGGSGVGARRSPTACSVVASAQTRWWRGSAAAPSIDARTTVRCSPALS